MALATEDMEDGEEEGILERTFLELRCHQWETNVEKIWEKGSPDKINSQCKGQMMKMNPTCPGLGDLGHRRQGWKWCDVRWSQEGSQGQVM